MQVVIDIDEKRYESIKQHGGVPTVSDGVDAANAILNGTPLPKGHDYIDRNNAITSICQYYTTCERMKMLSFTPNIIKQEVIDILCAEPTIIEADKESEEYRCTG